MLFSQTMIRPKLKASIIHFSICLALFLVIFTWAWFIAYPSAYFTIAGAIQGLTLVFTVDVVLGPLLSLLVYNPKKPKKELISDFALIGIIQLSALIYGLHTLYQESPQMLAIYPNGSATVINRREFKTMAIAPPSNTLSIAGLPATLYTVKSGMPAYVVPSSDDLQAISQFNRTFIAHHLDDATTLAHIDDAVYNDTGSKPIVLSVLAKYRGAYFVLDEQGQFLRKFGEKPL